MEINKRILSVLNYLTGPIQIEMNKASFNRLKIDTLKMLEKREIKIIINNNIMSMRIIKNKLESIDKINKLGLNKFPEQLFKNNNEENVKRFLQKYPADYYAIRDKSRAGGIFKLKVDYDKVSSIIIKDLREGRLGRVTFDEVK